MTAATATAQLSAGTWAIDPVHSTDRLLRPPPDGEQGPRHLRQLHRRVTSPRTARRRSPPRSTSTRSTPERQRDAHVKSADFFDAEQYPTATFTSTGVRPTGDTYLVDGDFTLKGVTRPVTLELEFNGVNPGMGHGPVAGFEASVVLNRKDFGIDIDMPLETGGAVVGDKITITLEIEALKQA